MADRDGRTEPLQENEMGVDKSISFDSFPRQGEHLGKRVEVCFDYDLSRTIGGVVVRDDVGEPGRTIIKLDDGRYVLSIECQYSIKL